MFDANKFNIGDKVWFRVQYSTPHIVEGTGTIIKDEWGGLFFCVDVVNGEIEKVEAWSEYDDMVHLEIYNSPLFKALQED